MASVMIGTHDGTIGIHVWYSLVSGEVWHFSVGKIVFVDQESGVLRPGWKRALARQAIRHGVDFTPYAFWNEELANMADELRGTT